MINVSTAVIQHACRGDQPVWVMLSWADPSLRESSDTRLSLLGLNFVGHSQETS